MVDRESENLCAKLMGFVGKVPVDEFYQQFNLDGGHQFSEFYFNEMRRIFNLEGMDKWPEKKATASSMIQFLFSLVCFLPPKFFTP